MALRRPTKYDDTIDSRDVIEAIKDLRELSDEPHDGLSDAELKDLAELETLDTEGSEMFRDWKYGVQLVRDSYFKEYAQQFAEDCGYLERAPDTWPFTCIDWDEAAKELRYDYSSVEFDGVTYWAQTG